jgi:tetratricopeptide (TPR) repeat protein
MSWHLRRIRLRRVSRRLGSALILVLSLLGIATAAQTGLARFLANRANHSLAIPPADRAVALSPADAEAHSARALALYHAENLTASLAELESAVVSRPQDYVLWLQVARARDEAGDSAGALAAAQEAVRLAPFYSDPRWQYGNILYRAGRLDEGFRELSRAAESNPSLAPVLIDLAWGTYPGNAQAVERIVAPKDDGRRMALARYFAKKGLISESLSLFRASGDHTRPESRRFLFELLEAKQFKAAYEVWAAIEKRKALPLGSISDPGFEDGLDLNPRGFTWRQERAFEGVSLSLENMRPRSGSSCLQVAWSGQAVPEVPILTQLVLVEPGRRYRLSFFVRTENVVTGGLPILTITDASSEPARALAQSKPFPQGTSDWQEYETNFETSATTAAILITLQREPCAANPCPMFGRVLLDDFALSKSR